MEHEQPETHGTEEQRHDGWRGRRPEPSANECVLNGSAEGDIECGVDFHVSSLDGDNANTLVTGGTQGVAVSLREGFRHQRERPSSSAFRNLRSNSPHARDGQRISANSRRSWYCAWWHSCAASWLLPLFKRRLPCTAWIPQYSRKLACADLTTGVTVGVVLVPQAIAYALLAELPPTYGLYSSLIPLLVFGVLTTSRHIALGPFALISMLVSDSVSRVVEPTDVVAYTRAVLFVSAMVGVVHLVMAMLRADFIISLLSDPVLSGFTSAAAILISLSQLKHVLGFDVPRGSSIQIIGHVVTNVRQTNLWALGVFLVSIGVLLALKKANQRWCPRIKLPEQLVVVVASGAFAYGTTTPEGPLLPTVGTVPTGLPHIAWPFNNGGDSSQMAALLPSVLIIAIFAYVLTMSVAKPFSLKHGYGIDANQELCALGMANIVGAFFSSYPVSASLSRSALVASRAKKECTPMHLFWQAVIVLLVLTLLMPAVAWLPYASLAAIVFTAVLSLFDPANLVVTLRVSRPDAALWLLAFLATFFLGVELGIGIPVGASLLLIVLRSMRPPHVELGRVPGTSVYRSRKLYPEARAPPRTLIFRWDASLHFANAEHFHDTLLGHMRRYDNNRAARTRRYAQLGVGDEDTQPTAIMSVEADYADPVVGGEEATEQGQAPGVECKRLLVVILDFSGVNDVDATALRMLGDLAREVDKKGLTLLISSCKSQIRDRFRKSRLLHELGESNHFARLSPAVEYAELLVQAAEEDTFLSLEEDVENATTTGRGRHARRSTLRMRVEQCILEQAVSTKKKQRRPQSTSTSGRARKRMHAVVRWCPQGYFFF